MSWLHIAVFAPFIIAIFIPLLYKCVPRIHLGWFVLAVPLGLFLYFSRYLPLISGGDAIKQTMSWIPSLGIDFTIYMDGLSLLFVLIITGIGFLVVLYSIYYLSKEREALHNFYVYLLLFMGAMLGVVVSDNLLVLYVFWELTSISSFLLIAYWYERRKSRYGAQKSLLITVLGGFAMLAGFLLLSIMAGTYSIREMIGEADVLMGQALFVPAMLLILLGAFTKSAQFPFHIWLPDAMEAPTPISAYLHSATMVKAGIYLVARLTPLFGGSGEWFWLVAGFGLITLFWGSFMAVKQVDLKALLAYSTISQLGLIMSLLGIGSAALYFGGGETSLLYTTATLAAMFHLVNHAAFKGSLFMVIGIVDHVTGTRDIRKLGGLMNLMPITFTLALIGSFSMAGLPPFNGFLSKEMFFTGVLKASELNIFHMDTWGFLFPIVAWLASVFTFIYCMIMVFKTFTGPYEPEKLDKKPHEAPLGMLLPPVVLGAFVIVLFFFPNILSYSILEPTMQSILPNLLAAGERFDVNIYAWHGFNTELYMTIGVIGVGSVLFLLLSRWSAIYDNLPQRLTLNNAYNQALQGLEKGSAKFTTAYMTGFVRDYLVYIFTFIIIVVGGSLLFTGSFSFDPSGDAEVSVYEAVLAVVMVLAAVYVIFAKTRLTAIVAVGAIGYVLSLLFVIFRAPDLALTQLVVETITVAIMVMCLYFLPQLGKELGRIRFRLINLLVSLGVGTVITLLALSVQGNRLFEPISNFFEDAYELAGANNMVNAILVDFRSFDTMMEVIVLLVAGLGVYTLVKLRSARRDTHENQ